MKQESSRIKAYLLQSDEAQRLGINSEVQVEFLAQGEYNKNYLITQKSQKYVFRINTGSQLNLKNQIEYEFNAIKKLEVSGVTPTGYFCDDSRSYFDEGVLLMNYLEGRPLNYKTDLMKAAEIFSSIHSLDSNDFEGTLILENALCQARVREADMWLSVFMESNRPNRETVKLIQRLYQYCDKHAHGSDIYFAKDPWLTVNNTEVNSHNFIIGEERSFLIDWEKPVISDPVQDITQFLAPTTTLWKAGYVLSDDEVSNFFRTYEHHAGRDIEERVKMYEPFLFLRAFSWCAGAWMSYTDTTRPIMNDSTFKVIESYLEPEFMKSTLHEYL